MSYNWINAADYSMDTLLLFDRWILSYIIAENPWYDNDTRNYKRDMAAALSRYPHVKTFCRHKAPECIPFLDELESIDVSAVSAEEARSAETAMLQAHETFVVYAYPDVMNRVNYIRNWNEQRLYDLVELEDKLVLDIGSGTGRLAFAAAKKARRVYASEPCDILREYMRDTIKNKGIDNVRVVDGIVTSLPYEDDSFDVVLAGHVVGDCYDEEIAEMTRVLKDGGTIVCCNGDDEFKRKAPNPELLKRGFEFFVHESCIGGIIYDYRKTVRKQEL